MTSKELEKIRNDLINLCEDNEEMKEAINEYFDGLKPNKKSS